MSEIRQIAEFIYWPVLCIWMGAVVFLFWLLLQPIKWKLEDWYFEREVKLREKQDRELADLIARLGAKR